MLAYLNILFLKLGKFEPVTSIAWVTNLVHTKMPWVFIVAMNSKIKKKIVIICKLIIIIIIIFYAQFDGKIVKTC